MSLKCCVFALLTFSFICAANVYAASNYSGMSTTQLSNMRHEVRATASPQDLRKFEAEWQKRLKGMPIEVKRRHFPDEVKPSSGAGRKK